MAEENDAQKNDVEAEMLRTMQEELGGDAPAEGGDGGADEAGADGEDVDSLLEEEMLKATEQEGGGGGDPMGALAPMVDAPAVADQGEEVEGINRLTDVEVEITVELGENLVPIQEIMEWTTGSVVELQPEEHEAVRVLLNGTPFAMGEIVVVGDMFGVRIVELLDPPEGGHH